MSLGWILLVAAFAVGGVACSGDDASPPAAQTAPARDGEAEEPEPTGDELSGTLTVEGDRLVLTDDPGCPEAVGTYQWSLTDGVLTLTVVSDDCAGGQRASDLTVLAWTRQG